MKQSDILQQYKEYLIFRNYRPYTVKSYVRIILIFLNYCVDHPKKGQSVQEYARSYLVNRFAAGKSWSSVNLDYSAIVILCKHILKVEWSYTLVPRPRSVKKIPHVLSGNQIAGMINQTKNLKHKTMISLLYSTGIRSSELINLDIADLCMDRHQLHVRMGKGGKDRIVQVPRITIGLIRVYVLKYRPKKYLFEGQADKSRYSGSSLRKVVSMAAKRQGIIQKITTHSLRHSYATHHLINGTDIVSLKREMGHSTIQTTLSYIHLCPAIPLQLNHPIDKMRINLPVT